MNTDVDGYPTTCSVCGKRIVKSGPVPLWFAAAPGQPSLSFHWPCRVPATRTVR